MALMEKCLKHFVVVTKHKWYVMKACFKTGQYWHGLSHDLSKYSTAEFVQSAKYFQGDKSPREVQQANGEYSLAWMNHKAKNKHHWQYWLDNKGSNIAPIPMPGKYIAQMMCDWIGAGKAYNKNKWTIETPNAWWQSNKEKMLLHDSTKELVSFVMMYIDEADLYKRIRFIRRR